jgi:hypothetical protein
MECEYTSAPVVTCDDYNIYVCRGDTVLSSDVGEGKLGSVPFTISQFARLEGQYYFLDTEGRLWRDGQLLMMNVRDFNSHHILLRDGTVGTVTGLACQFPFHCTQLVQDLLLSDQGTLYDAKGQYITAQVADAHTDGNEIIVIHSGPNRVLEYIGDNTNLGHYLHHILQYQGVRKAVVNQGSLLLLFPNGILMAAGANKNCECGINEIPVPLPRQLEFPAPVLDFGFHQRVGWALLTTHQLYVWGFNDTHSLFFLQWPKEYFISPRPLPL